MCILPASKNICQCAEWVGGLGDGTISHVDGFAKIA